jgi:hypothetical protein
MRAAIFRPKKRKRARSTLINPQSGVHRHKEGINATHKADRATASPQYANARAVATLTQLTRSQRDPDLHRSNQSGGCGARALEIRGRRFSGSGVCRMFRGTGGRPHHWPRREACGVLRWGSAQWWLGTTRWTRGAPPPATATRRQTRYRRRWRLMSQLRRPCVNAAARRRACSPHGPRWCTPLPVCCSSAWPPARRRARAWASGAPSRQLRAGCCLWGCLWWPTRAQWCGCVALKGKRPRLLLPCR